MKRIRIIFAAFSVLLLAAACRPEPSLVITPGSFDAESAGGTFEFPVTANYAWTATCSASWVTASASADGTSLKVIISQNSQPDARSATITLTCEELVKTFNITQAQKDMVTADNGEVNVSWEEQAFEVAVKTNVTFTVEVKSEGDWLTYVATKGLTARSIVLSAAQNASLSSREATVTVSYDGKVLKTLKVIQGGYPQFLRVVHNLKVFPAPVVFGFAMTAKIDWGDGATGIYNSTVSHTYVVEGEHEITIEATGAESATLSNLVGVNKIDLSEF